MKKIILILVLLVATGTALPASAGNDSFGLAWGVSLPAGNTNDFISKVSFRGAVVEWRHNYRRDAAWGLNVGWNVFNKSANETLEWDNVAVTGNIYRYINAVPIYAGWYKSFGEDRRDKRMYLGLNAGTAWIERRADVGLYSFDESNWHFAVAPEVGLHLPWDSFLGYLALRYHYAFEAGTFGAEQWLELKVGFGFD